MEDDDDDDDCCDGNDNSGGEYWTKDNLPSCNIGLKRGLLEVGNDKCAKMMMIVMIVMVMITMEVNI